MVLTVDSSPKRLPNVSLRTVKDACSGYLRCRWFPLVLYMDLFILMLILYWRLPQPARTLPKIWVTKKQGLCSLPVLPDVPSSVPWAQSAFVLTFPGERWTNMYSPQTRRPLSHPAGPLQIFEFGFLFILEIGKFILRSPLQAVPVIAHRWQCDLSLTTEKPMSIFKNILVWFHCVCVFSTGDWTSVPMNVQTLITLCDGATPPQLLPFKNNPPGQVGWSLERDGANSLRLRI